MKRNILNKNITKYIGAFMLLMLILSSCGTNKNASSNANEKYTTLSLDPISSDSTEYDIIITDVGYDSFLITQKPKNYFSQRYYENWNKYYVTDWNQKMQMSRYHTPKYQEVFDMYIDYDSSIDYGLDVNYKLYYYFQFVEKNYGIKFNTPRAISY